MNIFKYHGTIIFDSKKMFDRHIGIQSLGKLNFVDYEEHRLAFSGFKRVGKTLGTKSRYFYISLDRKLGKAYIFFNDSDKLFKRFKKNVLILLTNLGYEIEHLTDKINKEIT